MSEEDSNKQIVRDFFAAIAAWNESALSSTMHKEAAWQVPASAVPPYAGRHHGGQHIAEMMVGAMRQAFVEGSAKHELRLLVADDGYVIAETNLTGSMQDGRRYDNHYVFIFELSDGKITEVREHVDTAYAVQFFGDSN